MPEEPVYENVADGWPAWEAAWAEDEKHREERDRREREEQEREEEEERRLQEQLEIERQWRAYQQAERVKMMESRLYREEDDEDGNELSEPEVPSYKCWNDDPADEDAALFEPADDVASIAGQNSRRNCSFDTAKQDQSANVHETYDSSDQGDVPLIDLDDEEAPLIDLDDQQSTSKGSLPSQRKQPGSTVHPEQSTSPGTGPCSTLASIFHYKLVNGNGRYDHQSLCKEIAGVILESLQGLLEEQRRGLSDTLHTDVTNFTDNSSQCRHLGSWIKSFNAKECDACHMWLPVYTLVCPACGIRACASCKYQGVGKVNSEIADCVP